MSDAPLALSAADSSAVALVRRDAVLIIEDNETIAGLLTTLMRLLGLRVYWAASGALAEKIFAQHWQEIIVVLTDCRLPDGDGREVCLKLREVAPHLPVLVMSGSVSGRGVDPLPQSRLVAYLPKPYAPTEVLALVRQLVMAGGSKVALLSPKFA
ncbi:MAG: response regulator [Candidatus Didemnitutus sp.]|nr:response regulator [Candidatus Didemnitutus sp.]